VVHIPNKIQKDSSSMAVFVGETLLLGFPGVEGWNYLCVLEELSVSDLE
jgi:hypothetical protein